LVSVVVVAQLVWVHLAPVAVAVGMNIAVRMFPCVVLPDRTVVD
jgi:hypothetical protein